jgi:hypothetical protein
MTNGPYDHLVGDAARPRPAIEVNPENESYVELFSSRKRQNATELVLAWECKPKIPLRADVAIISKTTLSCPTPIFLAWRNGIFTLRNSISLKTRERADH